MKKISVTLLFYCLIGMIFYACCSQKNNRIIGVLELTVAGSVDVGMNSIPRIFGDFSLQEAYDFTDVGYEYSSFGLQEAYATPPCRSYVVNPLNIDLLSLHFDQPLELDSITLAASANILADSTFSRHITINRSDYIDIPTLELVMGPAFTNPSIFINGPMNIRLVSTTEDGLILVDSIDVLIDIQ